MIKKIVNVGGEELSGYEIEIIKDLKADFFVYRYESGSYEGYGFAIWKIGSKWFYENMDHCSCYGPTENITSYGREGYTFAQVKDLVKKNYTEYQDIVDYIVKNK